MVMVIALVAPLVLRQDFVAAQKQVNELEATEEAELEVVINGEVPVVIEQPGKQPVQAIEYQLPYPGILPDHPLYPLKVLRDRILDFLIRDPARKADFYLLMADKRLNMGIMLTEKKKFELAETTVSKGEKYLLKGVEHIEMVNSKDAAVIPDGTVSTYKIAAAKHAEAIKSLQKNSPENVKLGYGTSLKLVQEISEKLR